VIEDDPDISEVLRFNLEREGFKVQCYVDGEEGLSHAERTKPDLVLLDLMLPGMSGLEVCREIRKRESTVDVPVVMLTANGEETDIVVGLEMGADDDLVKPFSPRELVARIRSVLRRTQRAGAGKGRTRIEIVGLILDVTRHEVLHGETPVPLTRAEFRLLWALAQRPGRVFSRNELADEITAGDAVIIDRNVDVHISSLRKKLGDASHVIATVRGVGYKCID